MLDHSMDVTVNTEEQYAVITSTTRKSAYNVYKPRDQTSLFRVKLDKGVLPEALSGRFSSLNKGIEHVVHYLEHSQETFAAKSDRLHQERQERNAPEPISKDSQLV